MDFITRLYESDYFIISLFSVIAILVFTFIIIAIAGKKNKEKVDEFNDNLNDTSSIPTDNVAFADTTPEAAPLEVPVAPIEETPVADISVADSEPIYESPDKTMDFSDTNLSLNEEEPELELTAVENEEPIIESAETPVEESEPDFKNVFEHPPTEAPINPFESIPPVQEEPSEPVFENTFPEPEPATVEENYNPALENTAKINLGEQFSSVFVDNQTEEEMPTFQPEPQPTIDDIELPKMADESPTEDSTQF